MQDLKLFDQRQIRTVWDEEQEKWYFCINDVIVALTDCKDPVDYFKKVRKRDPELDIFVRGTICPPHQFISTDGKRHSAKCMDIQSVLRLVQSIPSKKAEPFKRWLAQLGAERIHQMQDPELGIQQSLMDYKRLGYSDNWINQRLKSIEIRKELTDEWKRHGLQEGVQFATLTDIIYQTWADMTAREYKRFKGLKKENLRDNMTNKELVLNMLAELSTKEISESRNPETFNEHQQIARQGGEIARNARIELEEKTGKAVISPINAKDGLLLNKAEE